MKTPQIFAPPIILNISEKSQKTIEKSANM